MLINEDCFGRRRITESVGIYHILQCVPAAMKKIVFLGGRVHLFSVVCPLTNHILTAQSEAELSVTDLWQADSLADGR